MISRGRAIVKSEGWAHMKVTVRCNDGTALYPGMAVTRAGQTAPDVGRCDAYGEPPFAILGLPSDQDIDTNFEDNDEVVAYMIGSGAVILSKLVEASSVTAGEKLYADDGDTGWLMAAHMDGLEATASLGYQILKTYVGIAMETLASNASLQPVWVALV